MIKSTKIYMVSNIDKNPNKVYIGKTRIKYRESQHKVRFGNFVDFSYIDEIDSFDRKDWKPVESFWIEQFRQWGFEIINKNAGGGGPEFHSDESKQKMSFTRSGKSQNSEWVNKRKKNFTGVSLQRYSCEFCNKDLGGKGNLSKHRKSCKNNPNRVIVNRPHSEETKNKLKKPKPKVTCPHCNLEGGKSTMMKWHFNNCKYKIQKI